MAAGPETNLWKAMQRNLPTGCIATRLENRHGGGVPDVLLMWDGVISLVELKAPKSRLATAPDPAAPCQQAPDPAISKTYSCPASAIPSGYRLFYRPDILRPEQKAFAARACSSRVPVFILARPQISKEIKLLRPDTLHEALRLEELCSSVHWPEVFAALRLTYTQNL